MMHHISSPKTSGSGPTEREGEAHDRLQGSLFCVFLRLTTTAANQATSPPTSSLPVSPAEDLRDTIASTGIITSIAAGPSPSSGQSPAQPSPSPIFACSVPTHHCSLPLCSCSAHASNPRSRPLALLIGRAPIHGHLRLEIAEGHSLALLALGRSQPPFGSFPLSRRGSRYMCCSLSWDWTSLVAARHCPAGLEPATLCMPAVDWLPGRQAHVRRLRAAYFCTHVVHSPARTSPQLKQKGACMEPIHGAT